MKRYKTIILSMLCVLSLTGCGHKGTSGAKKDGDLLGAQTSGQNGSGLTSAGEIPEEEIFLSKEEALAQIGLTESPKTVVATTYAAAELLDKVGSNLVGVPEEYAKDHKEYEKYAVIGTEEQIDYEALKTIEADLYVFDGAKREEIEPNLAELKLPTYFTNLHYVNTVYTCIQILGITCGDEEKMKEVFYQYLDDQQKALVVANGKAAQNALLLMVDESGVYMGDASCYFGDMITKIGAINISYLLDESVTEGKKGYLPVNVDAIVATNPQVIFIENRGVADPIAQIQGAFGEQWDSMLPVINNDIHYLDDTFKRGGLDNANYLQKLADIVYGDQPVVVQ